MSVGAVQYRDFEDFLKKTGHENDVKGNNQLTGTTNGIANSTIKFAQDNDIFTANKMFGNKQTSDKENSGSGAASSGGFLNNIVSGTASWVINTLDIGGTNNTGDLSAAATGHTPQMQAPQLASALTGATGNENPGAEGGSTDGNPQFNATDLYQQFLDAQREAKIEDNNDNGEPKPTGEGTISTGDNVDGDTGNNGVDGTGDNGGAPVGDGANGAVDNGENPVGTDNPDNDNPEGEDDPANNDTSQGINQQEVKQQEQLKQQQELEKLRLQRQEDEEAA